MDTKEEIKKAVVTEPVKLLVSGVLLAALSYLSWAIPAAYQLFWMDLPRWGLIVIILLALALTIVSVHLRMVTAERNALRRRILVAKPKKKDEDHSKDSFEPDELDLAIMNCLYNSKDRLEAAIIAEIFGIRYGEAEYRLETLETKGLVQRNSWVAGGGFQLSTRGKKLIFGSTPNEQT